MQTFPDLPEDQIACRLADAKEAIRHGFAPDLPGPDAKSNKSKKIKIDVPRAPYDPLNLVPLEIHIVDDGQFKVLSAVTER